MKNINEGNGIDIDALQKYFCRQGSIANERQLLTVPEILAITGLTSKKLGDYLYESGKYSSGATFDCSTASGVQSFRIYNH